MIPVDVFYDPENDAVELRLPASGGGPDVVLLTLDVHVSEGDLPRLAHVRDPRVTLAQPGHEAVTRRGPTE